jgi:hypothetical protein
MSVLRKALIGLGAVFAVLIVLGLIRTAVKIIERPGDEERVETAIESYYESNDPSSCEHRTTATYRSQRFGEHEPFALALCEQEAPSRVTPNVRASSIEVNGDRATASARFAGSILDGSTVRLQLVDEGGWWRLDELLGFVHFDREGFRRGYRNQLLAAGATRAVISCVAQRGIRLSDRELEVALVDRTVQTLGPIYVGCNRAGAKREVIAAIAGAGVDLTAASLDCVERKLSRASEAGLVRVTSNVPAYFAFVKSCDPDFLSQSVIHDLEGREESVSTAACVARRLESRPLSRATVVFFDRERYEELIESCNG